MSIAAIFVAVLLFVVSVGYGVLALSCAAGCCILCCLIRTSRKITICFWFLLLVFPAVRLWFALPAQEQVPSGHFEGQAYIESVSVQRNAAQRFRATILHAGKEIQVLFRVLSVPWKSSHSPPTKIWLDVRGEISPLPKNPFPWTYDGLLIRQGFAATGTIDDLLLPPLKDILPARESFVQQLLHEVPATEALAVLLATTLGENALLNDSLYQLFLHTGLMQQLVVSGYQIVLLWRVLMVLLCFLSVHLSCFVFLHRLEMIPLVLSVLCVGVYFFVLPWDVPATRAWCSLVLFSLVRCYGRRAHHGRVLLCIGYILQLIFPGCVFDMSFQLTFAALSGVFLGISLIPQEGPFSVLLFKRFLFPHLGAYLCTTPLLLIWTGRFDSLSGALSILFGGALSLIFIVVGGLLLFLYWLMGPGSSFVLRNYLTIADTFLEVLSQTYHWASACGKTVWIVPSWACWCALVVVLFGIYIVHSKHFFVVLADETHFGCYREGARRMT